MAKDKKKKRSAGRDARTTKDRRWEVRAAMVRRGIKGVAIARELGITQQAVSKGCAKVPRIIMALIRAGVPKRVFRKMARAA